MEAHARQRARPPRAARAFAGRLLVLLAALTAIATLTSACTSGGPGTPARSGTSAPGTDASGPATGSVSTSPSDPATTHPSSPARPSPTKSRPATGAPVHIQLKFSDGNTFGVGIPVIAFFSRPIRDASALQAATTVQVNGRTVTGGRWYFETSAADPGYPIEGDYRLRNYWPAHSKIFMTIPAKGLSAGHGLVYDDNLTLTFFTGAAHILTVNGATHKLTVRTDGKTDGVYPVSLGADATPTLRGTKVIMEKGLDISMRGPGYFDPHVKYTQRLTYGGEYLHSAPWNIYNIEHGIDSSNGCTNLLPEDAIKLFHLLRIGDVVTYRHIQEPTTTMTLAQGYGDWNVPWAQWQTGGDVARI
jgi:lipoprotein-anchoring transpeptidase ErfK/SrfK